MAQAEPHAPNPTKKRETGCVLGHSGIRQARQCPLSKSKHREHWGLEPGARDEAQIGLRDVVR